MVTTVLEEVTETISLSIHHTATTFFADRICRPLSINVNTDRSDDHFRQPFSTTVFDNSFRRLFSATVFGDRFWRPFSAIVFDDRF